MSLRLTARSRLGLLFTALVLGTSVVLTTLTFLLVRRRIVIRTYSPDAPADPEELADFADQLRGDVVSALLTQSAIALGIVTVLAVLLGWLVAGRILRPIRAVSATAQRLSAENLSERVPVATPTDELSTLARTINGMLDRIQHGIAERDRLLISQRMFVANAAHELRTPLTTMRTAIDVTLDDRPSTEDLLAMAADIHDAVEQSQRILDGLLLLARSEIEPAKRHVVDLADLAARTVQRVQDQTSARNIRLYANTKAAKVSGEPVLLQRAIDNIVDNAVRYNEPGGHITVTTGTVAGRAELSVANTGKTVAPYELARLFEPFVRGSGERTRTDSGTGLGLSIVRAVVSAHHGEIGSAARPGGGLDINLSFPPPRGVERPVMDCSVPSR